MRCPWPPGKVFLVEESPCINIAHALDQSMLISSHRLWTVNGKKVKEKKRSEEQSCQFGSGRAKYYTDAQNSVISPILFPKYSITIHAMNTQTPPSPLRFIWKRYEWSISSIEKESKLTTTMNSRFQEMVLTFHERRTRLVGFTVLLLFFFQERVKLKVNLGLGRFALFIG